MPTTTEPRPRLSLMDKWKNHYYGRGQDAETTRLTNAVASIYFWFISVTELYCFLCYVLPFAFSDFGDMFVYYTKVFVCYIFVNATANWACVKCYSSSFEHTRDRPDLRKFLWDNHPDDSMEPNGQTGVEGDVSHHGNGYVPKTDPLRWKRCLICQMDTPPRAHHCKICQKCILKRDHHCYLTGVCIGFHNQRFFIMMNFFAAIASLFGFIFTWNYMSQTFLPETRSWIDFVLPVTVYNWWRGACHIRYVFMTCQLYTFSWTAPTAVALCCWHVYIISKGKTSHEVHRNVRIRCTAKKAENFRSVFGAFWGLNFVFPAHILFKQTGDGTEWDGLKKW